MRYLSNKNVQRYQQGGPMAAPEAAPAEGGAPAPGMEGQMNAEDQLAQIAGQLVEMLMQQIGDPSAVAAILEMALQMVQEAAGQGQPVFAKGGKIVKKAKKAACGAKMAK